MTNAIQCYCSGNDAYCAECHGVGTVCVAVATCSIQPPPVTPPEYDWAFCAQCVGYTEGDAGQCRSCGCWYQ